MKALDELYELAMVAVDWLADHLTKAELVASVVVCLVALATFGPSPT